MPIAFWDEIWYTNNAKRERVIKKGPDPPKKFFKIPLDTKHKMCYNKDVNEGEAKSCRLKKILEFLEKNSPNHLDKS